jgi:tetraacyldisaccharide 4'-kinase
MRIVERYSTGMRIYLARGGWSLLLPLRYALSLSHALLRDLTPSPRPVKPAAGKKGRFLVVSVGNLVAGGAGKTPCVLAIASHLMRRGLRPAVVSGGYGGAARHAGDPVAALPVDAREADDEVLGDEAALYPRCGIPVVVCRDRRRAIETAARELDPTHILLDDAFHHTELAKDLDILLLDHGRPFGNGLLLPAGPLRERPTAARRADAIVFTRARGRTVPPLAAAQLGGIPVFFARHVPAGLSDSDGNTVEPSSLATGSVVLFSGIARPDSFEELAQEAGLDPAVSVRFDDHHRYGEGDVELLLSLEGPRAVFVTTAKDWPKALSVMPTGTRVLRLDMRMEIDEIERLLAPVL